MALLEKHAIAKADGAIEQRVQYFPGIGTDETRNAFFTMLDQAWDAAFGGGMNEKIIQAYTWIAKNYEPGDEIYAFGFSRGAYTARSLIGFMRGVGITEYPKDSEPQDVKDAKYAEIQKAFDRYRDRSVLTYPSSIDSADFRYKFSPRVYTGRTEKQWRTERGYDLGVPLKIKYIGIWDTVGSLGVPGLVRATAGVFNTQYLFHDANLSSMVWAGRHAVATDERRRFYPPTLWTNLNELQDPMKAGDSTFETPRDYRQEWFPGDHGVLGGSGKDRRLSAYAMHWVLQGARDQGLVFETDFWKEMRDQRGYGGRWSNLSFHLPGKARVFSSKNSTVSKCTLHRLAFGDRDHATYRPEPLRREHHIIAPMLPTARCPDTPADAKTQQ